MKTALVIGGGFAGCCAAHHLGDAGFNVTVLEKEAYLGGGCKTFTYAGHPYTYGPRHFITKDESLFNYLNAIVPMRRIDQEHRNLSFSESDGTFFNFPIHADDVARMADRETIHAELEQRRDVSAAPDFEDYVVGSLGPTLYRKFFDGYSKKMWQIESNRELDGFHWGLRACFTSGMELKKGNQASWDDHLSAFPYSADGYDDYFAYATRDCQVRLNTMATAYDLDRMRVRYTDQWYTYDVIISTLSPEILLDSCYGRLRWMGRRFHKLVLPLPQVLPQDTYFLYYPNSEQFTRIVEYKKFYRYTSDSTLLVLEEPADCNALYPYPILKEQARADRYLEALPEKVFSIGRMGTYRYTKMDEIILQCREVIKQLKS
ncbi:MAG: FAD-dependent oxidoreductase [Desulfobacterales bacterium]|nr:FAD-dependent oxidoreductase [Desulfobacterales bacterium]